MGIYFIGFFLAHPTEKSSKQFTPEKSQEESSNICKIEDKTPIVTPQPNQEFVIHALVWMREAH